MTTEPSMPMPVAPGPWPPPAAPRRGLPTWAKVLLGVGIAGTALMVLMCSGLVWLGVVSPETRALSGSQLTRRNLDTIRDLGLIEEGERIKYFYSDGLLSIEEGMYFFTADKIVLYGRDFDPPSMVVTYDDVADITADFSDSWWIDGTIWIELEDDSYLAMPISSEGGADEFFYDSLVETWKTRRRSVSAQ